MRARVEIGALQIIDGGADDDARAVVILLGLAGAAGEIRQLGQRHVHAEDPGARFQAGEALAQVRLDSAVRQQVAEQKFWCDIGRDGAC